MSETALIDGLLAQLTLEEKVALLSGSDMWHAAGVERLDIPPLKVTDGPHGARGGDFSGSVSAACLPCGTAMGATWNPALIEEVGAVIGDEAITKSCQIVLGPTVNLHRTPIAGRNFECYAEDPHLSARIGVAWMRGLQSRGVGGCVKHFVCNDSEFERHTISSEVGERALRELYLAPFEAVVQETDPWSVMTAYNRINGTYACDHPLLADVLRGEWGFRGVVISDWFGLQSTEAGVVAGNDLEMPGPGRHRGEKLFEAVQGGRIDEKDLDACVRRMLEVRERAGILQGSVADTEEGIDRPEHRDVARRAATESIVLLKNEGDLLPLATLNRIAVIGPNAPKEAIIGGGSSKMRPHYGVSPLDGIRARAGDDVEVIFEPGCTNHKDTPVLSGDFEIAFHAGLALEGEPIKTQKTNQVECMWLSKFDEVVDHESFSVRVSGRIEPQRAGGYQFGLSSAGKSRLLVDGEVLIDNWDAQEKGKSFYGMGSTEKTAPYQADGPFDVIIEYSKEGAPALGGLKVGCLEPIADDAMERAEAAARVADVAVVVVGLNADWETEGRDRLDMLLPGDQAELVERVVAANPRTVVVVNAGSPIGGDWMDAAPAILAFWYAGQEGGNALADILFGDVCPSGRLPQTWPVREEDNPAHINYPGERGKVEYGEGVFIGYRWYEKKKLPARFAFGHGLSYTSFAYGELTARVSGDSVAVSIPVTNTGARAGQDVVQLYVRDEEASVLRPEKELRAFAKVDLEPGQTKTVEFGLERRDFSFWDPDAHDWALEPGDFTLLAGSSSADIRATEAIRLEG
jgi:beta-glucosidase